MARVRLTAPHYLGAGEASRYYEAGSVIDLPEGIPVSREMEGADDEGRALVDARRPIPNRPSRDRLPTLIRDPMARQPGTPRAAGPPGQEPQASADPASPERTADIVEARKEFAEQRAEQEAEHAEERQAARAKEADEVKAAGAARRNAALEKARAKQAAKRAEAKGGSGERKVLNPEAK